MKFSSSFLILCFLIIGCSQQTPATTEKEPYSLELELSNTQVIKLNGKEIHVDLLQTQLESLAAKYHVNVTLMIDTNTPFGIVHDVNRIINSTGIKVRA